MSLCVQLRHGFPYRYEMQLATAVIQLGAEPLISLYDNSLPSAYSRQGAYGTRRRTHIFAAPASPFPPNLSFGVSGSFSKEPVINLAHESSSRSVLSMNLRSCLHNRGYVTSYLLSSISPAHGRILVHLVDQPRSVEAPTDKAT